MNAETSGDGHDDRVREHGLAATASSAGKIHALITAPGSFPGNFLS